MVARLWLGLFLAGTGMLYCLGLVVLVVVLALPPDQMLGDPMRGETTLGLDKTLGDRRLGDMKLEVIKLGE